MSETEPNAGSGAAESAPGGYAAARAGGQPVQRPLPPPVEVNTMRIIVVGSALWFVAFLVMLPFVGDLFDAGQGVWLWTALSGWVLGLIGIGILHLQQRARRPR